MKNLYALLLSLLLVNGLSAQLADGSKVPAGLTLTDINGNTHVIQDYLDAGKVVLIDIYATWCGPCWYLHTNHALENLWQAYGPDGTDEMVIISIEGDATTSHEDLLGTGGNTQGDWVTGVSYPIVEDNTIPTKFGLTYWPTIFIIRPSGSMLLANDYVFNNVFDPSFDYVHDIAFRGEGDARITTVYGDTYFCGSYSRTSYVSTVKNVGTDTLTSATVELLINGEVVKTKDWTGSLTEFKSGTVSIGGIGIEITETSEIELRVVNPNGVADSHIADNSWSWNVIQPEAHHTAKLTITTDFWPEEISWEVTDPSGEVVASSADLGTLSCDETYEQEFPLIGEGCYKVSIADVYGDGLLNGPITPGTHSCGTPNGVAGNAMGAIALEIDGGVLFDNIAYGAGIDVPFNYSFPLSVNDIEDIDGVNVYPNPVTDNLTLELNATRTADVSLSMVDMMGRVVGNEGTKTLVTGLNKINVSVNNLTQGTYFLRILQDDSVKTIKFDKM